MARAVWNGKVIAESDATEIVEGNVYFPEDSLKREYFRPSSTTSTCPWKGQARYLNLLIDGQDNPDAAWYYPEPSTEATREAAKRGRLRSKTRAFIDWPPGLSLAPPPAGIGGRSPCRP